MSAGDETIGGAVGSGSPATAVEPTLQVGLREQAITFRSACRQIFGIPDYERYLAHAAARHPGKPVLTRSDFCVQAVERRYGKGGMRCC